MRQLITILVVSVFSLYLMNAEAQVYHDSMDNYEQPDNGDGTIYEGQPPYEHDEPNGPVGEDPYNPNSGNGGSVDGAFNSNSGNMNSNNVNVQGDSYTGPTSIMKHNRQAPSMMAPQLTSGMDMCTSSTTGAATGPGFGLSVGKTTTDKTCEMIKLAKLFTSMGLNDAAVALLYRTDKRTRKALQTAYPKVAAKFDPKFQEPVEVVEPVNARPVTFEQALAAVDLMHDQYNWDPVQPQKPVGVYHQIVRGDTLWSIGKGREGVRRILTLNPGLDAQDLPVGQNIRIQ